MANGQLHDSGEHPAIGAELDPSDPELLFDHLYENYEPMVERWVRRLAGPSVDIEDLIHDVFVVALRRRGEFRGDAKVSTWLFRIAQLVVRKCRFRHKLRQCLDILHRSHELAVVPPSPTPLEVVEQRQQNARLYAAWIVCLTSTAPPSFCATSKAWGPRRSATLLGLRPTQSGCACTGDEPCCLNS
jgi:RNA polymerase sigma factor (sigma-70 family)